MRLKAWLVMLAVSAAVATVAASDGVGRLPAKLAGYRSWTSTSKPRMVPFQSAMACLPDAAFLDTQKTHGPHGSRWVRVYANRSAASAMRERDLTDFPVGSIIVKEKLLKPTDSSPEGVAFMIKHGKGAFTESGGWEFVYYPLPGKTGAYKGCVTCHRVGAKRDYVFGTEPEETED